MAEGLLSEQEDREAAVAGLRKHLDEELHGARESLDERLLAQKRALEDGVRAGLADEANQRHKAVRHAHLTRARADGCALPRRSPYGRVPRGEEETCVAGAEGGVRQQLAFSAE